MEIDLVFLTRDRSLPRPEFWEAVQSQAGVRLSIHRVVGASRAGDPNRWETIARARNIGKSLGTNPWLMFVDDDVILQHDCAWTLLEGLQNRPGFAALAADYQGEMASRKYNADYPPHVVMGATLFRRERLDEVTFRWEENKCECQCCCEDIRRKGLGIGYCTEARAWHRPSLIKESAHDARLGPREESRETVPRIMTAFNRRDYHNFLSQFLASLRATGNEEPVTAVGYGLRPSEQRMLSRLPGVELFAFPENQISPATRRVHDFQEVLARWPGDTPVACWDAGDIKFQQSIGPLWKEVRANPAALLAVIEPKGHPENSAVLNWSRCIHDRAHRHWAFGIMSTNPFVNAGFMASTAGTLLNYLREGDRLLQSEGLRGLGGWGDQVAFNLYIHTHPGSWVPTWEGWNYTLFGREPHEQRVLPDGAFVWPGGELIPVVHGNAGTMRWTSLSPLAHFADLAVFG